MAGRQTKVFQEVLADLKISIIIKPGLGDQIHFLSVLCHCNESSSVIWASNILKVCRFCEIAFKCLTYLHILSFDICTDHLLIATISYNQPQLRRNKLMPHLGSPSTSSMACHCHYLEKLLWRKEASGVKLTMAEEIVDRSGVQILDSLMSKLPWRFILFIFNILTDTWVIK